MILDEDPMPPPPSGSHDVVMTPASEPTPAATVADCSQPIEVSEPSPAVEMLEPPSSHGCGGNFLSRRRRHRRGSDGTSDKPVH
jgi:hypothetical protein